MPQTTFLKPGLLVNLKTQVSGGVHYQRDDVKQEIEGKTEINQWMTLRTIDDVAEHKAATEARSAATGEIRKVCIATSFGLLCPLSNAADLEDAINKAQAIVTKHNERANYTRVKIYVLRGQIADSDEQAQRAVAAEVAELLEQMKKGIESVSPETIRDAANRATRLGRMLDARQSETVNEAVAAARKAARSIVKRIEKAGEDAKIVLAEINSTPINAARFAFLDMADENWKDTPADASTQTTTTTEEAMAPQANVQRFAELDFDERIKESVVVIDDEGKRTVTVPNFEIDDTSSVETASPPLSPIKIDIDLEPNGKPAIVNEMEAAAKNLFESLRAESEALAIEGSQQ